MDVIKTTEEDLKSKTLAIIKEAIDIKTTDVVPVDVLQKEIQFLRSKIDELIEEVNTIKDALIYRDDNDKA